MEISPTILIVDDELIGRKALESLLAGQGYHLLFAADGEAALKRARDMRPDLILLDVMMPNLDGYEVCRRLRADPVLAEVPVLMVTALDDQASRLQGIEAGADDFISKPYNRAELRARVRTVTRLNRYRRMQERSVFLAWIVEHVQDGFLRLNSEDQVLFANSPARRFLGLAEDADMPSADTFRTIAQRQYRLEPQDAWTRWGANLAGTPTLYLVRPETELAHEFWLEVATFDLLDPAGHPHTRLVRLRNVTADMLNRRHTRGFGLAVNHKFRTPISTLVTSLDLLARHAPKLPPEEVGELAVTALHSARRLQETLERVLQYARLPTLATRAQGLQLANFRPAVEKAAADLGLTHVTLTVPVEFEAVRLVLPSQSMDVLLWEILDNSRKFHPTHTPVVTIEVCRSAPGALRFVFTDNGLSLSPKQLAEAWLPFYQGEKNFTGEAPGLGLGLPTASAIIWGAGGQCRIANRPDGPGVTVEFIIPEAI